MHPNSQRWRQWAWLSMALASALWIWLLAGVSVYTAAMSRAAPLLEWLRGVWAGSDDMGHGPFLPLISVYVIYLRRKAILASMSGPDWRGVAVTLAGAVIFWAGLNLEEVRFCVAALVVWVWSVPFAIWGEGVARQLVFPAGYLLLSIPRWNLVVFFTMKLRLLAAAVAVGIANGVGISTTRIGTGIHSEFGGGFNLDVAEPCSGLRSLFAMVALAGAYAFFTQRSMWRKWLLFACAAPVAVLGNIARIVAIIIVAAWLGEEKATGFYHDYSGYIVFLVAILALVELGRWLARWKWPERWRVAFHGRRTPCGAPEGKDFVPMLPIGSRMVVWALPPLILLGCGLFVLFEPPVRLGSLDFLPAALPAEIGAWRGSPVWHCHNEQCLSTFTEEELVRNKVAPLADERAAFHSAEPWVALRDIQPRYRCPVCETGELFSAALGEQQMLSADTCILRSRYTGPGTDRLTVSLVIAGFSRNSLHNPHLCLPAQGFAVNRIGTKLIPVEAGKSISIKVAVLEKTDPYSGRVSRRRYAYWFFTKDRHTSSVLARMFWAAWTRAIRHRSDRWVMMTVVSDRDFDSENANDAELLAFASALMGQLRPADPVKLTPPQSN